MLSQLLDPDVYAKLSDRDLERISAIVDAELIRNPEIHKILKAKVDPLVPSVGRKKGP